ncbi:MAG: type II toxin-antitoxin system HipA family toxin [Eubacteriales bacterium]|jgi:serine/threonine-protein kinase HipA
MIRNIERVSVYYHGKHVGTLQQTAEKVCAFQYSSEWLLHGFSISPFSLPLEPRVFLASAEPFQGLFGVFDDSLPDGWGRMLMDRMLRKNGLTPSSVSPLTRLSIIGATGKGALEYIPDQSSNNEESIQDMDNLCRACQDIYDARSDASLDQIYQAGGSSGGARPKVYWKAKDGTEWLVKFPCSSDSIRESGETEYRYMRCAEKCGIRIPEINLLDSSLCSGYFASKRFDRNGNEKVHMISAAGLLECSFRLPCLDYEGLIRLTGILTHQNAEDLEQIYRVMCFNFAVHNTDDHARNFSFLYKEDTGWELAPAYDLTYANAYGEEHMTALFGEGAHPDDKAYLKAAKLAGINKTQAVSILNDIKDKGQELKINSVRLP